MSAGYQVTLAAIQNEGGALATRARDLVAEIVRFKAQIDGISDGTLEAAPISMAVNDVADLRSAMSDLAQWASIWAGAANLAVAKDFTAFTKRLTGVF